MRFTPLIVATTLFATAGFTTARSSHAALPSMFGRTDSLVADPGATTIRWVSTTGASGTIPLRSGLIVIRHERIVGGKLMVDVSGRGARISNTSSSAPTYSPIVELELRDGEHVGGGVYRLAGILTARGTPRPVTFQATASWPETGHLVAEGRYQLGAGELPVAGAPADVPLTLEVSLHARRQPARVASR